MLCAQLGWRITSVLLLIVVGLLTSSARAEDPRIDLDLTFSVDGGVTYTRDFPVLDRPGIVKLRATWNNPRPANENQVYTTFLRSEQQDFGSANCGRQTWMPGKPAWYQRPVPYWLGATANPQFEYDIDVRGRPEGVVGYENRYDPEAKKNVSAPLPACPPLGKGTYQFTLAVGYVLKNVTPNRRVQGVADFMLIVKNDADPGTPLAGQADHRAVAPPKPAAATPQLDLQMMDIGKGQWEFPIAEANDPEGKPLGAGPAGTRRLAAGKEACWVLKGIDAGRYHLGVVMSLPASPATAEPAKLYVDGERVPFGTSRKPGQVDERTWQAEYLSRGAMDLRDGVEVRLVSSGPLNMGRLALYSTDPGRGPIDVAFDEYPIHPDKLRASASIVPGRATFTVTNVTRQTHTVEVSAKVIDYFQRIVAESSQVQQLLPRQPVTHELAFTPGDAQHYRIEVEVSGAEVGNISESAECLSDERTARRSRTWLSGTWQFTGLGASRFLTPPATDAQWIAATVPGRSPNSLIAKEHCGWFRRTLDVPPAAPGERRELVFDRVIFEATVLVNGREVGKHLGGQAGFAFDVTDYLKPGTNELMVGVRGNVAALSPEDQVKGTPVDANAKFLWPGASARTGMGDVYLITRPSGGIDDVAIRPSFRNKRLDLEVTLGSLPAGAKTLRNTVYHGDQPVLRFEDRPLNPSNSVVKLSQSWANPILWGLHKPQLLRLESEILDAEGKRLDLLRTRFGFREFWPEGTRLLLNGEPINFRAYAMNDDAGVTERMSRQAIRRRIREGMAAGGTMERHIYSWHNHADVADEEGQPIAIGLTGEAHPTQFKFETDIIWERAAELMTARVRQLRNHPSIFEWYLTNEFTECAPDVEKATERVVALRDTLLKVDDTRIYEAGCDLDLRGALNITCTHYPVDIAGLREPSAYLPDSVLWRKPNEQFVPGMKVPAGQVKRVANVRDESPITWGAKPIIVNETGWIYFFRPLYGLTSFMGDEVYRGPETLKRAHEQALAWFIAGHRDAEVSLLTPWRQAQTGMINASLPAVDIFPIARGAQWYEGTSVQWPVNVYHDTGAAESLMFRWALVERQSQEPLASGESSMSLPAYGLIRTKVAFTVPETKVDRDCEMRLALVDRDGQIRHERRYPARVVVAPKWTPKGATRVGLFDPAGASAVALSRLGVEIARIDRPDRASLSNIDLLVIGEQAGTHEALDAHGTDILSFVEAGGRVLTLHQDKLDSSWYPLPNQPVTGQISSITFPRSAQHPVLRSMTEANLRFWFPDHIVTKSPFIKPVAANVTPILECGNGVVGLNLTPLMELKRGRGRMIFSQLVFAEQTGKSPMADRLVLNALDYLAQAPPVAEAKRTAVITADGSPLQRTLRRLLIEADFHSGLSSLGSYDIIILDATANIDSAAHAALRTRVQSGGQLVIHGATSAQRDLLNEIIGKPVRFETPTPPGFAGRMLLKHNDPWTDGLCNQDLFWNRHPDGEDVYATYSARELRIDEVLSCAYDVEGATPMGYPAGLVRVPVGEGMVYLDGVRWDLARGTVTQSADRIAFALLGNIGVGFTPQKPVIRLTGLIYEPIDITAHMNRALKDDVAEDGVGGWSDQGPDNDMRNLPTGRNLFAGVPFEIATPQSCIVLASKFRSGALPAAIQGIRIGRKTDALHFLHSSAWTSNGLHATYRVHYADGVTADIPLEGGVNLRDWVAKEPDAAFMAEISTYTQVGWTGQSAGGSKVSVYVMQWANPRPEVVIDSVDFIGAGNGVPILLGITAGSKAGAAVEVKAGDRAKAQGLDAQARAAVVSGKMADARRFAGEAVNADPTYVPARVRLADLLEQGGDLERAEAELRQIIAIDRQHLETYLTLGRIYEQAGRMEDAMQIYRSSMEANPNQPLVVQAIERLQKQAK